MQATPPPICSVPQSSTPGTRWTKIIGIIAIIFGAGGILQGAFTPVSLLMVKKQMQSFAEMGVEQTRIDEYLAKLSQVSYPGAAAYGILGILLLTGGILLLRHRRAAASLLQVWAVLKITIGGLLIYKNSALTRMQMDLMLSSETFGEGKGTEAVGTITSFAVWIGLAFGFIWLCVLPVFVLIWFNRRKIKEEISIW